MARKFVSVKFKTTPYKDYHFLTDIEDLKRGDIVVVDTALGVNVAEVQEYVTKPYTEAVAKWVISKVDLKAHKQRVARERKLMKIKEQMDARKQELQDIQLYEFLAAQDDSMADLLNEYKELLQD